MVVFCKEALQYLIIMMLVDTLIVYNYGIYFLYQHYAVDGLIVSEYFSEIVFNTYQKHGILPWIAAA